MTDPKALLAALHRCLDEDEKLATDTLSGGDGACCLDPRRERRELRLVAAHRKILDIHGISEHHKHEWTGEWEGGCREYRIVSTDYLCSNCEDGKQRLLGWPCATVSALIELYADRLENR